MGEHQARASEPVIRHWTNSENIPIAMITTGTMSGVSASPFRRRAARETAPGQAERGERPKDRGEDRREERHLGAVNHAPRTTAGR